MTPTETAAPDAARRSALRRAVLWVAGLNLAYMVAELLVAFAIGSVSLAADGVDFFEDFAVNLLIAVALGWSAARQATVGRVLAGIILLPAVAALVMAVLKAGDPEPPAAGPLFWTALGAIAVNLVCTVILARFRSDAGSLTAAAYLAARNDLVAGAAILVLAGVTRWTGSGWPDILLGIGLVLLNGAAAREVWEKAGEERLAERALEGEFDDD
ncbi:cation transporter [Micrococcus sp. EYE_162]|uniref:cation transporter n=1 Tax=unclassified Micrococcus TaxID=2620948 RepID=UPI0020050B47|nr:MULTISPECIES: cation transporter [unclassified Micrococcus]MCK6096239.1 cation transporter [Micrococcus sp. EYE_212]MCK6171883.1 cation transporter [Micrococcus sp. EYE_162]